MRATTRLGRNIETVFRLTPIQEGILYHSLMPEARGTYVQQYTSTLKGKLDKERFRAAWKTVIRRHPAMRSRGVGLKLVYTGHGPQPYNYDGQFRDAFPNIDHNRVTVSFRRDANHRFTRKDHRDELVSEIGG